MAADDINSRLRDIYATILHPEGEGKRYLDEFTEARLADQFSQQAAEQLGDPEPTPMDLSSPNPFDRQYPPPVSRFAEGGAVWPTEPSGDPPSFNFNTPAPMESGPPAQVYAEGGTVDFPWDVGSDDYGAGRFTRSPAERRAVRERAISQHVPAESEEWNRFISHPQGPLGYGMEAVGRLDRAAGAASQGDNALSARDYWDFISPDPQLRREYGYPGAAADALSMASFGATGKIGKALGWAAPLIYGAGEGVAGALGFAGGGKVAKIIKEIGNKFGSYQGSRIQRAADETNLERLSSQGLRDAFDPESYNLFVSMPPGDFQDYASLIPKSASEATPYPRAHNVPGRLPPEDKQTQDWYLDGIARMLQRTGAYAAPDLVLGKTLDNLTNVVEHEGRHRMMAMDRLGDPRSLVQLRPTGRTVGFNDMEPEERVDWLTQKYFPHGKGTLVVPQGLPGPWPSSPIRSEPYADGGLVADPLAGHGLTPAPAAPQPEAPKPQTAFGSHDGSANAATGNTSGTVGGSGVSSESAVGGTGGVGGSASSEAGAGGSAAAGVGGDDGGTYAGGGSVDKIRRGLTKAYGELFNKPISVAVPEKVLPNIIDDGRFKTQFETGRSRGMFDPEVRAREEAKMFGLPLDLPPEMRPVYGHIADRDATHHAMGYGDWNAVLKPEVKDRSTFYFGDSLETKPEYGPYHIGKGMFDPGNSAKFQSWLDMLEKHGQHSYEKPPTSIRELADSWHGTPGGYIEAQVHGGLPWGDVNALLAKRPYGPGAGRSRFSENFDMPRDLGDMLMRQSDRAGVPAYAKFKPGGKELTADEFSQFVKTGMKPEQQQWLRANPGMRWEDIGTDELKGIGYANGGRVLSLVERLVGGKPKEVKLPGGATMPAYPIKEFEDVAEKFAGRYGNQYPIDEFPKLDEDRARKIAEAYELMQHNPADPRVKRAYDALIDETMDQYKALEGTGARFEFLKPGEGDPYAASPSLGYKDLVENGRLKVFPTEQGYGTQTDISDNPLLRRVGRVGDLDNATANDAFRVVHDALGHFGPGNPFFRAPGEERAWLAHSRAYSPDALPAATSETRGQNSWVNFGPRSAENKGASGADTIYADQKAGLLPEWMYEPDGKPGYRDGGKVLKGAKRFLIDPLRESFSGIYKDPDQLVREAKEHMVPDPGKEGPMYRLFGHTRDSLDELSQGNRDLDSIKPFLGGEHPFNLSGTADVSPQVLTNRNAGRLVNMLGEALEDPAMRTTRSWYEMSPMYDVMNEIGTGDKAMRDLNNRTAVMSAGSDPRTEINRGFHANWLAGQGRLEDFVRHGGTPDHLRDGDFPDDLRSLMGHAYHATAHLPNLLEYEATGRLWPSKHKVPTYAAATDPKNPYSARPIADSHFNRILGYPDVSTATTEAVRQGVPSGTQYSDIVPWFNDKVAGKLDIRPRDAQALLWNVGGPQTGVRYIGPPKLEMIADYMDEVARLRQIDPMQARDQLLRGEIGGAWEHGSQAPFAEGGSVTDLDNQYMSQFYARGGSVGDVLPLKDEPDDFLGHLSMYYGV